MRRRFAISVSLVALLAGCSAATPATTTPASSPIAPSTPASEPSSTPTSTPTSPPPTPIATTGSLPSVLNVTCTVTGTTVAVPRAAVQRDGVHFHITNTSGESQGFEVDGFGGDNAPDTEGTLIWALPTGSARIRCSPLQPVDAAWVEVELLDPAGFYVPDHVACSSATQGTRDYAAGARGVTGDPVTIATHQLTGLKPGDQVQRAGYPGGDAPKVRVVRDGSVVAVGTYQSDQAGGWLIETTEVCDGTGLGWGA